jgi:hypothetical protein
LATGGIIVPAMRQVSNAPGAPRPRRKAISCFLLCSAIRRNHAFSRRFFSRRGRGARREQPSHEIGRLFFLRALCASARSSSGKVLVAAGRAMPFAAIRGLFSLVAACHSAPFARVSLSVCAHTPATPHFLITQYEEFWLAPGVAFLSR